MHQINQNVRNFKYIDYMLGSSAAGTGPAGRPLPMLICEATEYRLDHITCVDTKVIDPLKLAKLPIDGMDLHSARHPRSTATHEHNAQPGCDYPFS